MTRAELMAAWRLRVFDTVTPYLWSDPEGLEYLDDAINEAAERASLLRDAQTAAICEVAVTAPGATYELDERVLEVLRAKLDNRDRPLVLTTTQAIDIDWPGWQGQSAGEPRFLVIDPAGALWSATLVPPPSTDTVLRLQVYRLPLAALAADTDEPEIHPRQHIKLLDWMCYRAYSKHDAETKNDEKATDYAATFAATFGPKRDARTGRAQHDMQFPVVRPVGL